MKTVQFRQITVERMPGIRGLVLNDLISGINVILGPNAAGKSTLARAAGYLLWPKTSLNGTSISAQIVRDLDELTVCVEQGKSTCNRFGLEVPYPAVDIPSAWAYFLGLPDLLLCEDKQIAQEVIRQIMGGFDISAACTNLGFYEDPAKPQGLKKEVQDADTAVETARKEQRKLEEDEKRLVELCIRLSEARASSSLLPIIECALELQKAQIEADTASILLSQCDHRAGLIRGDELERLKTLQSSEDSAASNLEDAQYRIAESKQNLSHLSSVNDLPLDEIEDHLEKLRSAEASAQQAVSRLASAKSRIDAVNKSLPDNSPTLTSIDPQNLNDILEIARKCSKLRQQVQSAGMVNEWVGQLQTVSDLNTVRNGVVCLQRWLRTPPVTNIPVNPYLSAACGVIVGLGLGLIAVNPLFALLCLVGLVGFIVINKRSSQHDTQSVFRTEYEKLSLEMPQNWNAEAVEKLSETLIQRQAVLEQERAKQERWADSNQKLESLERDFAEAENQLEAALKAAGFALTGDETDIVLLADALIRHRTLSLEIIGLETDLHRALDDATIEHEYLENILGEKCSDYASARRTVDSRKVAVAEHKTETERYNTAIRDEGQARKTLDRARIDIGKLYTSIELEPGDFRMLETLLSMKDRWNQASKACMEADLVMSTHRSRLRSLIGSVDDSMIMPGTSGISGSHANIEDYLVKASPVELESLETDLRESIADIEPLIKEIKGIEKSIEIVKRKHDLEILTIQRNAKRDTLRGKRSEAIESTIGWVLADYIRNTSTDHTHTLLSEARKRFTEFTAGEFSLELDTENQRLAARRSSDGENLSLDQLSSGTRAQLVIAARMAYIESQETEYALPLMLDESLATSDDDRAGRIAQSISKIAKQGRQILYFTAQSDEVQKWQKAAKDVDVDFICLKLH